VLVFTSADELKVRDANMVVTLVQNPEAGQNSIEFDQNPKKLKKSKG
jgi:hypothetical protein